MKCSFCGKELERGTQECPYCHCSIEAEVQVLRPEERDTFDGVTIEQDKRKKFFSEFAIRCDTLNIADVRMVSNYLHLPLLHSR